MLVVVVALRHGTWCPPKDHSRKSPAYFTFKALSLHPQLWGYRGVMLATPESTVLLDIGAVVPIPYHKGLTVMRMIEKLMIYELLLVFTYMYLRRQSPGVG